MKRGRLPLTALRSFEAAGRHLSFSRAAEELYVSQAAISRQIRDLETRVGGALFERHHRRVALTEAGGRLLSQLTKSFDEIDALLSEIQRSPAQAVVKVSVEPNFASSWLVPRLNRFQAAHPDIDVAVDIDHRLIEFRADDAVLAIRHSESRASWPRTQARHLFDVSISPVVAPSLLASGPPLREATDLARHTLLHEENRDGWSCWLRTAGAPEVPSDRGPIFPTSALAVQAAMLGHGVALGDIFSDSDMPADLLVRPFGVVVPYGTYWLVAADFGKLDRSALAFAEWLLDEARGKETVIRQG